MERETLSARVCPLFSEVGKLRDFVRHHLFRNVVNMDEAAWALVTALDNSQTPAVSAEERIWLLLCAWKTVLKDILVPSMENLSVLLETLQPSLFILEKI